MKTLLEVLYSFDYFHLREKGTEIAEFPSEEDVFSSVTDSDGVLRYKENR